MEIIPIPYFGMLMSLFVAPLLTYGFILLMKRNKCEVEKLKYKKEILELEIRKDLVHLQLIAEENKKYDRLLESEINHSEISS
jgi:hypothetical protein